MDARRKIFLIAVNIYLFIVLLIPMVGPVANSPRGNGGVADSGGADSLPQKTVN